jgi:hypothetical protein
MERRMKGKRLLIIGLASIFWSGILSGQELMIYPNEGQDADKQEMDEFKCYGWAKDQSGFDPMAPPTATEAPPQQEAQKGGLVRGAAGGAAVGAIIDGGDGAAKGAAAGAVLGGMRRNSQKRGQQQEQANWEQEQAQQYAAKRNSYNRAYAACLEGRGYTVR